MRIPLKFDSSRTSISLFPTIIVNERMAIPPFLIDTGSVRTTLSYYDAKSLAIDFAHLERARKRSLTYAGYVTTYRLRNAEFLSMTEDRRVVSDRLESIDVLSSTGNRMLDESLPSVIGMDFLNECSYALHVCPKREEAFLEKC